MKEENQKKDDPWKENGIFIFTSFILNEKSKWFTQESLPNIWTKNKKEEEPMILNIF